MSRVRVIVLNVTYNNIPVTSWRSDLMAEKTGENHRPTACHGQTLSHNIVSTTPRLSGTLTHNVSALIA
jgi:hypothetical protein